MPSRGAAPVKQTPRRAQTAHIIVVAGARPRAAPSLAVAKAVGPAQERANEAKREIEQGLAAHERELGAVVESLATVLGEVRELSAVASEMPEMLLQITDAIKDPRLAGPAADGAGSDGSSQWEEVSLATKYLNNARKLCGTKKHWVVRAYVTLAMVDIFVAELQSAVREIVYVTPAILDQLRYMSSFDVLAYVPRNASFAASDMTAFSRTDHMALFRDFLLIELCLGLYDDAPQSYLSLRGLVQQDLQQAQQVSDHTLQCIRARMLVLACVINRSIAVRESDLFTYVRCNYLGTVPPNSAMSSRCFLSPPGKG